MIESFELRLQHSLILYNNMNALLWARKQADPQHFNTAYSRISVSSNAIAHYNVKTRKDFGVLALDYNTQPVVVASRNESETLLFSHAMTRVCSPPDE